MCHCFSFELPQWPIFQNLYHGQATWRELEILLRCHWSEQGRNKEGTKREKVIVSQVWCWFLLSQYARCDAATRGWVSRWLTFFTFPFFWFHRCWDRTPPCPLTIDYVASWKFGHRLNRQKAYLFTTDPFSLQDGVLSEREFKKFFECFLRYAFFDVVPSSVISCFRLMWWVANIAL